MNKNEIKALKTLLKNSNLNYKEKYVCGECDEKFRYKNNLKKHIDDKHLYKNRRSQNRESGDYNL